ncbi:hypothetical protein EST38_g2239 [Candolleomyces aberdarensis]|uniref:Uncharacterized protein n=1 Tax=Candolleomyces aberdarensis TaxID=2316362 RepID=A0A4Q2DXB3_9AGAR|nr:hypothetical protein EST38_g2239 [Candolleomyces aberdarensis]
MGGGKSQKLKAPLRRRASAALFPILRDLGIQAALTHKPALALHLNVENESPGVKVVVKHDGEFTIEDLCTTIVSHAGDGYHFTRKQKHLEFISADPQTKRKTCRVTLIPSGGSFPTILEDFSEVVYISDTPVLPIHAILLEELVTRSRLRVGRPLAKGVAKFVDRCLRASDGVPLPQLSPLWQSPEILDQIAHHVQLLPDAKTLWIAHGIDASIFILPPLQQAPGEGANEADDDDDDDDDGRPNPSASERPPVAVQAPDVAIQGPDHVGHSAVTDVAARHVVSILEELGFECAVSGSAAYQLYSHGETRLPQQLDILVLPPASFSQDQAWLKQQIFQKYPNLFKRKLEKGTLSYMFPHDIVLPQPFQATRRCRVEFVFPRPLGLPHFSSSDIVWIDNLPVMPFLTSLRLKLEIWAGQPRPANTRDVKHLLSLVPNLPVSVFRPWRERNSMSDEFQAKSEVLVKRFCRSFQDSKPIWQMLGFEVEDVV